MQDLHNNDSRPVWAEIDLDAIAYNLVQVKSLTKAMVMAIVKANAYGHGVFPVAKKLLEVGADRLGVATLGEALELRQRGITAPIMILGFTPEHAAKYVVENDIIQTIFSKRQAQVLSDVARDQSKQAIVHLKIDSGMNRIGFDCNKPEDILAIRDLPGLSIEGAFTHFAVADITDKSFTLQQLARFKSCVEYLESKGMHIALKHAANSAAIIDLPEAHLDMVRPGIMLYGLAPSQEVDLTRVTLKPAMALKARIAMIKTIMPGATVSYGRKYEAKREITVATLPLGYADGYSRVLSHKVFALLKGKRVPVIGSICMDQCMLDVSDVLDAKEGDEVILFGSAEGQSVPVEELADIMGTINYEIVCMIGARVPRVYPQ